MRFHPYLNFNGQCGEAFRFYETVLGGKLEIMTYADSPMADPMPGMRPEHVLHAALTIGDQMLMGSDAPPEHYREPAGTYVSLSVESVDEARRIFDALAEGARIEMAFAATFWSPGFGSFIDRWGTPWMVNTTAPLGEPVGATNERAAAQ